MKTGKKVILTLVIALSAVTAVFASDLSGLEIINKAHDVPEPDTSSVTATLVIHSKKGNEKTRRVIMKRKDYGTVTKEVIVFTSPKDVSGVGYLMFDYPEASDGTKKDSENWLYMPAMKKVKRIAAGSTEAEGNFMGTDFTYEDMGERAVSKDNYTLLGREAVNGVQCYKVRCESIARTENDPDRVVYIGVDDFLDDCCLVLMGTMARHTDAGVAQQTFDHIVMMFDLEEGLAQAVKQHERAKRAQCVDQLAADHPVEMVL